MFLFFFICIKKRRVAGRELMLEAMPQHADRDAAGFKCCFMRCRRLRDCQRINERMPPDIRVAAAHEAALKPAASRSACWGMASKHQFPSCNAALFDAMKKKGTLVTEFSPDMEPRASYFPQAQSHQSPVFPKASLWWKPDGLPAL